MPGTTASRPCGEVERERQCAEGSTIKLGNAPWVQLRNGHAKVPGFLPRLSNNLGESYAPSSDPIQACLDRPGYPCDGAAEFASMADGLIAGAGDNCPLLARDEP
jgi:hypothetical protein